MWHISGRLGNQMFQFAYIYAQMRKGLVPDVYLQSEEYFAEVKDEIKQLYGASYTKQPTLPYVSIHVRRGDYVNNSYYVDLFQNGYYERAMQLFPSSKFMVFSDDLEWCKKQEVFKDCEFSEGFGEIEDMNRMIACEGHIIANSSYSWWAAYISGKKTVGQTDHCAYNRIDVYRISCTAICTTALSSLP